MPIYEFVCARCHAPFEELVHGEERVTCPACRSEAVEKRFSTFAARGAAPAPEPAAGGCGTCGDPRGPGACRAD